MKKRAEPPAGCLAYGVDYNRPMECQGWSGLNDDLILMSHFTGGKNKVQRGDMTCSRTQSKLMVMLGLAPSVQIKIRDHGQEAGSFKLCDDGRKFFSHSCSPCGFLSPFSKGKCGISDQKKI